MMIHEINVNNIPVGKVEICYLEERRVSDEEPFSIEERQLLKAIAEHVPAPSAARIDVKELNIAAGAVTMKAETDTYESAAQIEATLQQEPRFKAAKKADEKKIGDALSFTITIPLTVPDAAASEATAPTPGEEG